MLSRVLSIVVLMGACLGERENVRLQFELPPGVDLAEARVLLFPFDLGALIDSVGGTAITPRPEFTQLERELHRSEPANPEELEELESEWKALRGHIIHLADSLGRVERTEPGYAPAYDRLRRLYADLTAREADMERRLEELMSSDGVSTAERAARSSDSLRQWEQLALADLPNAVEEASARTGRQPTVINGIRETGLGAQLAPGTWWVVIRVPHPENTFLEYYWNVPFTVNPMVPVVVPIGTYNMETQWRH